jgi:hypothetical protein
LKKKKFGCFLVQRREEEKRLFYYGLRIILPIQIQWKEIGNPKHPKIP